jgi:transcriptional regulator of acetoin/glycerol metabolism
LLRHWLTKFNALGPRYVRTVAPEVMRALLDHDWPGNVRELRNVIEYAFAVGRGESLELEDLPPEFSEARSTPTPLRESSERERIREALQLSGGRVGEAAQRLGMSRATFWRKRRHYGLQSSARREE